MMDLPLTKHGNRHVVIIQDFLTKFPLVFPVPDQKAIQLIKLLAEEVISLFGMPADQSTNMLSHVVQDQCKLMEIKKLNTTAYHSQCDGMVEHFNRTLKTILHKYTITLVTSWIVTYRNVPHELTGEKPS